MKSVRNIEMNEIKQNLKETRVRGWDQRCLLFIFFNTGGIFIRFNCG
jgi:hypothetical protein